MHLRRQRTEAVDELARHDQIVKFGLGVLVMYHHQCVVKFVSVK